MKFILVFVLLLMPLKTFANESINPILLGQVSVALDKVGILVDELLLRQQEQARATPTPVPSVSVIPMPIIAYSPVQVPVVKPLSGSDPVVIGPFQTFLARCESGGKLTAVNHQDAEITGYPSYGKYQFQPLTFQSMGKKYGILPSTYTMKDVMNVIYDEELQDRITRRLLLDGGFHHWKNCHNKYLALL